MTCKILKIIYKLLPFPFLRALIIDKHFSRCKNCSEELELDEIKIETGFLEKIDLWESLKERILLSEKSCRRAIRKIQFAFAISLIIVSLGLCFITYINTINIKKSVEFRWEEKKEGRYAIVENAYIRGKRAKVYIFKTKEPDISIVWLEPEKEVNYK